MADNIDEKIAIAESEVFGLDLNEAIVDPIEYDDFDETPVPGDTLYVDPDMADPSAGIEVPIDLSDPATLPVTNIDLASVTKTRKVLATGEVVYDLKFNVVDVGANAYEVSISKI